ncbi:MAG: 4Fe-4S dicluster domain-containing protein, partial [Methanobacteriota archaeon]
VAGAGAVEEEAHARVHARARAASLFKLVADDGPVPLVYKGECMDCGGCLGVCPHRALELFAGEISVNARCTECDLCVPVCPTGVFVSLRTEMRGDGRRWRK